MLLWVFDRFAGIHQYTKCEKSIFNRFKYPRKEPIWTHGFLTIICSHDIEEKRTGQINHDANDNSKPWVTINILSSCFLKLLIKKNNDIGKYQNGFNSYRN